MRRNLLPSALLLVALVCGAMAVQPWSADTAVHEGPPPVASPETPVLSSRRAPGVLSRTVAERRLRADLVDLMARTPDHACLMVSVDDDPAAAVDSDRPVTPASNLKLLTGAAVLHHLAADERLVTEVAAASPPADGTVEGDLWFVGGGDPVLATAEWSSNLRLQPALSTSMERLADRVRDAGVRHIRGAVVGDDGRYDEQRYVASWPARYRASGQTGPLSALSVNDGFTGPAGRAFDHPAAGAAGVLTDLLRTRGITVDGEPRAGRAGTPRERIAAVRSPTIAELVGQMLRDSDNGTAELLVKELGYRVRGEGSTAAGVATVRTALEEAGHTMDGVVLRDGSGLDPANRVTCRLLHDVLAAADPTGPLVAGLPVAGRTGTLQDRFVGGTLTGRIRAKTGTIRDVLALAGFLVRDDAPRATFAYVLNGPSAWDAGEQLQQVLGEALLEFPDAPDPEALAPLGAGTPPVGADTGS